VEASKTTRKTKPVLDEDDDTPKGSHPTFKPHHSKSHQKFKANINCSNSILSSSDINSMLPNSMQNADWSSEASKLSFFSLANSTWSKYNAAFKKFLSYISDTKQIIQ
jgi:hypothetical protein